MCKQGTLVREDEGKEELDEEEESTSSDHTDQHKKARGSTRHCGIDL